MWPTGSLTRGHPDPDPRTTSLRRKRRPVLRLRLRLVGTGGGVPGPRVSWPTLHVAYWLTDSPAPPRPRSPKAAGTDLLPRKVFGAEAGLASRGGVRSPSQ